jgi:hypothetical protein
VAIHRFAINVPNGTDRPALASLRLEPVSVADLADFALDVPSTELKIRSACLSLDDCPPRRPFWLRFVEFVSFRRFGHRWDDGCKRLEIELEPQSAVDVHVAIKSAGREGVVAINLVDRREGRVAGGVTLLVIEGHPESAGQHIEAKNPCPVVLADEPNWLPPGSEPDDDPTGGPIPMGYEVDLVAWITNPTQEVLAETTAYLEHLGSSQATFVPTTWNVGDFEPGARFPLVWRIQTDGSTSGSAAISIVAASIGTDPIRLAGRIELGGRGGHEEGGGYEEVEVREEVEARPR